jgi:YVTN family beta-propeller protein
VVAGLGLLSALGAGAQRPLLLVANQADHNLSLIDPATNKQIAAVDVGGVTGHEVAASPDGRTAFVPIYGNSGVGKPGTDGQSIAVIDLGLRKIVHTIAFSHGVRPHLPVFDAAGKTLYVTTELDQAITAFDPTSYKVVGTYPTGAAQSHMFVLSHDGKFAYTANVGAGSVSVVDLTAKKVVKVIPVAKTVQRISMSRDGAKVFTSDQDEARLAVIDTGSNAVKGWIPLPAPGYGTASTKDGRYLLVALRTLKQVAVVDLQSAKVVKTIGMPGVPVEILVRPDGADAYVSCGKGVAVVNTGSFKVDAVIDAGNGADGLAWAK